MRRFFLRILLVSGCFAFAYPSNSPTTPECSDLEYQARLGSISCMFEYKFTPAVKDLIVRQTSERGKGGTEIILGRSRAYFPIFERALAQYGLPMELSFVAWIESHLTNAAISPQGAGGIWQFMPGTAELYGLRIDRYVDERLDVRKSTEAAARLFARLYVDYQDWALALAAYNCGSLRVNKAIKTANSNDYWKIAQYLPSETQLYVPRFIAAAYIGSFHVAHQLVPVNMPEDLAQTDTIMVYEATSFARLSGQTGVPEETIRALNPCFLKGTVPASKNGYAVTLPLSTIAAWKGFPSTTAYAAASLAALSSPAPAVEGPRPVEAKPVEFQKVAVPSRNPSAARPAAAQPNRYAALGTCVIHCIDGFIYYVVQPGETIRDIVKRCPAVNLSEVEALNGKQATHHLEAGDLIKIGRAQ